MDWRIKLNRYSWHHTIIPDLFDIVKYEDTSPDEVALCNAAFLNKFEPTQRTTNYYLNIYNFNSKVFNLKY